MTCYIASLISKLTCLFPTEVSADEQGTFMHPLPTHGNVDQFDMQNSYELVLCWYGAR